MQRQQIYLLRHGEIDTGYRGRFVGQVDPCLSANGILQAQWWEIALSDLPFEVIYCSDLSRSRDTAKILSKERQIPVRISDHLREINLGEWDGIEKEKIKSCHPEEWALRGEDMANYRPPRGESFSDLASRIIPVFQEIARDRSGNRIIAGHAGANRVILCHVLGMPLANVLRIGQDYGCLNIIESSGNSFRVRAMNIRPGDPTKARPFLT